MSPDHATEAPSAQGLSIRGLQKSYKRRDRKSVV